MSVSSGRGEAVRVARYLPQVPFSLAVSFFLWLYDIHPKHRKMHWPLKYSNLIFGEYFAEVGREHSKLLSGNSAFLSQNLIGLYVSQKHNYENQ